VSGGEAAGQTQGGAGGADRKYLAATRRILEYVGSALDARVSVRLWDGTMVPLGRSVEPGFFVSIAGPQVLGSLLRRPSLETALRHYAAGRIDFHGGDLITFGELLRSRPAKRALRGLSRARLIRAALPLLRAPGESAAPEHRYRGDETGRRPSRRDDRELAQFHYDLGNEFFALFLDPEMQYSCAYYRDWERPLEAAQLDKLEMICRKLRLRPGERLLDVGCGWGGLVCHAARHYGVEALGVTLSQRQLDYAREKIRALGLEDRVRVALRDYSELDGRFDKIASIGMYEHVGIANYRQYFRKLSSLLRDRGILLNHGITRRAKSSRRKFNRIRPGRRLILKYIFPGSELDHIGHTLASMESCGYEIHDVEDWREHYALTTRHWCRRLSERKQEAIQLVGPERYRLWVAYLAGVSFSFHDGSLRVYQTVASKHTARGLAELPPTRADLYRL
jgi:cyclopropane-fatty-acyl-phospholipid synthase